MIDRADVVRIVGGEGGSGDEVALDAVDAEAGLADRREVRAAREEGDLVPGLDEARAEVAAGSAETDDREAHGRRW